MSDFIQMSSSTTPVDPIDLESSTLPPLPDDPKLFHPQTYTRTFLQPPPSPNGTRKTFKSWFPVPESVGGANGGYSRLLSTFVPGNKDIFVVSYPNSGAGWVKGLVEECLNMECEGDEVPMEVKAGGDGGEEWIQRLNDMGKEKVRVFMTHLPFSYLHPLTTQKTKILYIARNPKDVARLSYLKDSSNGTYTGDFNGYIDAVFLPCRSNYGSYWSHNSTYFEKEAYAGIVDEGDEGRDVLTMWMERIKGNVDEGVEGIRDFVGGRGKGEKWRGKSKEGGDWIPELATGPWKDLFTVRQNDRFTAVHDRRCGRIAQSGGGDGGWGDIIWDDGKNEGVDWEKRDERMAQLGLDDNVWGCRQS